MKAEEYYENHFAPFEITVVSKETVIELMEQYAQQQATAYEEWLYETGAAKVIYYSHDYSDFINHQNQ